MLETKNMTLTDEEGNEFEVEIVLTFDSPEGKHFVLFKDPDDPEENVYPYAYDDDGNMFNVEDEKELEMCEEVLGAFESEEELGA